MIRPARTGDVSAVVALCRQFFEMSGLGSRVAYDSDSAASSFFSLLNTDAAGVFVIEAAGAVVGAAAAIVAPLLFNLKHSIAQELFWYVDPEHRGGSDSLRLVAALERWASEHGATLMLMAALEKSAPGVRRVYARRGYIEQETNFIKGI